ncbi:MAG TPA: hypothetical protein DHV36_17675 [Desulfobacteraceae bacterium]|nr:hypothetical protein [Desulfobacteraceae bacterium]
MPTQIQADASEMFRSVLDALPQHIAVLNDRSDIVFVNQAWKRFGDANTLTVPDHCVGMNYLKILTQAGSGATAAIAHNLKALLAGDRDSFAAEYPCHAKDRKRWFKVTFNSLTAGGQRWATASHENVTQLWQTNQDLVTQEQKLKSLVDAIPDPICMLDKTMRIVWSNDRAKDMFGPNIEKKKCVQAYGSTACTCQNCIVQDTFTDSRMRVQEYEHTDIDGTLRTFRCRTSVAGYAQDGSPSQVMEIMEDVTAQRANEKEIRVLSQAVEYSPVTVVITDTKGIIEYVNPKFTEITGYTSAEAIGKNPKILSAGKTTAKEYRDMWETISSGGIWQGEFVNKKKNGDLYWEAASISPIRDEKNRIIHYVAVKEDITDRKQMIKELETAKEMAESATRAKTNFLATMSHEIRTPMNAILGMSRLVMESDLDNTQQRYVSNIHGAADALLAIINDILDLTKIEADKMDLVEKEFQLGSIVEKVFNVLKYTAREKGISLIYRHNHPLPLFLIGDATRISQILMNLIANALKYTPTGTVSVTSDLEPDGKGTPLLRFRVKDTGIGMDTAQMKKLFQPFTQMDGSTARKYGGTGLGLSIVKRMVDIMHGRISVTSTPDAGSEFSVTIPLQSSHSADIPHLPMDRLGGLAAVIIGSPTRFTKTLAANLGHLGLDAVTTETIRQGTRELESQNKNTFVFLAPGPEHQPAHKDSEDELARFNAVCQDRESKVFTFNPCHDGHNTICGLPRTLQIQNATMLDLPLAPMTFAKALIAQLNTPDAETGPPPSAPHRPHEGKLTGKNILVVDDDSVNREIAVTFLTQTGASLFEAEDGPSALELVRAHPFDLVFMDIQMPGMDGYETTRRIRKADINGAGRIPIVALTGHALKEFKERCERSGMNDCLVKPIKKEQLFQIVFQYIDTAPPQSPPQPGRKTHPANPVPADATRHLDFKTGLSYTNQNRRLYLKMLSTFCNAYTAYEADIRASLSPGLTRETRRLMHKLKSTARMIGATELTRLAAELEQKCPGKDTHETRQTEKDLNTSDKDVLKSLLRELAATLAETEKTLDAEAAPSGTHVKIHHLLSDLSRHIKFHRPLESRSVIRDILLHPFLSDTEAIKFNRIKELVTAYRFKEAERLLSAPTFKIQGERAS